MPNQRLTYLFDRYIQGTCTPAEKRELSALALTMQNEGDVQELLDGYWEKLGGEMMMPEAKSAQILREILGGPSDLRSQPSLGLRMTDGASPVRRMTNKRWGWAAAAILVLLTAGSYFIFFEKEKKRDDIVRTETPGNDVKAPETNRAMITLANGEKVYLDSSPNGVLATQGNINIQKLADGQITYTGSPASPGSDIVTYNTLSNPRGSRVIWLSLTDGTKVWLNAESSLTYPTSFIGNERQVTITGEAYFEVAKDPSRKFIVTGNEVATEVLGTHFNINAYPDESSLRVTLLEGSVKVAKGSSAGLLKPGQQAQVTHEVKVVNNVDVDAVMAWKNGYFQFNRASLQEVLRQLTRWYDVEVAYEGRIADERFGGEMQRTLSLSQVLKLLEKSGVHFKIEGKKIVVMP